MFQGSQGEIVVHLYIKDLNRQKLDVLLYEDELQVKFCTGLVFIVLWMLINNNYSLRWRWLVVDICQAVK